MNKKGDISVAWIITIVIIIVGFGIILWVYFELTDEDNFSGPLNREACAQSVLIKANIPVILDKKVVDTPLKCKTEKICVSRKGESDLCESVFGTNAKDVKVEKIVSKETKEEIKEIHKIVADNLLNCWDMMGRGKLEIFPRETSSQTYNQRCLVCAQIAFSGELKSKYGNNYIPGVFDFLNNVNVPKKDYTYLQFLTNSEDTKKTDTRGGQLDKIYLSKSYYIVFREFSVNTNYANIGRAIGGLVGLGAGLLTKSPTVGLGVGGALVLVGGSVGDSLAGGVEGISRTGVGGSYASLWALIPTGGETSNQFYIGKFGYISSSSTNTASKSGSVGCWGDISSSLINEFGDYRGIKMYGQEATNVGASILWPWGGENKVFQVEVCKIASKDNNVPSDCKSLSIAINENQNNKALTNNLNWAVSELMATCFDIKGIGCSSFEGVS